MQTEDSLVPRLSINRLTLSDFRNYRTLRVETGGGSVILTGDNGAGKTNLLEAVSMLVPGRGLRGATLEDLVRVPDATEWAVAAEIDGPHGEVNLGTAWRSAAGGGSNREVRIKGEMQKTSGSLGDYLRIIWLTPSMDRLFAGPAGDRRRYIDRLTLAFDNQHNTRSLAFERLMRERNRLLSEPRFDPIWISGLEQQLAEAAVAIAAARNAAIDALQGFIGRMTGSTFPRAELAIEGELESRLGQSPAVQVEDEYRRLLHDSRLRDQQAGRCLSGPHRSDLHVRHAVKGIQARMCSTGEQKALLIAVTLAHARAVTTAFAGWAPVLLLDEIAAHLDTHRRAGLFGEIAALGCQAWMTGTDATLFEAATGAKRFTVADGNVCAT